jgi:outer membrane protein assembly factor BamB
VVVEVQDLGFACLEQATGAVKWEVRNAWLEGPPTATHDGRLWLRLLPAGLRCLDLRSGATLSSPDLPALGTVVGAPVVRGREVVAALKAGVLAIAGSSGPPRLTVPLKGTPLGLTDAGERLLLATLTDPPELVAVEPGSGSIAWRRQLPVRPASEALVRDGRAYVLDRSHGLSCFALRDGSPLWTFGGSGRFCCGDPVFDDRGVLWADDQGRIWAVDDQPPADLR